MKSENNGKTLSGSAEEMKPEFYRQVKADEFQNGYWQWKFYSNFFNQFESLPNKNPPAFYENIKYACEMTEKHPEYAVLNRKPAEAGGSRFVHFKGKSADWLGMLVCIAAKYYLIDPKSMNYITDNSYFSGEEIPNAYECTQEELKEIKDSLFSS